MNDSDDSPDASETDSLTKNHVLNQFAEPDSAIISEASKINKHIGTFSLQVWIYFLVLGVGTLLPWNMFITAKDYFIQKTHIAKIETEIVLVAQTFNFVSFIATLFVKEWLNASTRITISLGIILIGFFITVGLVFLPSESFAQYFAIITIICVGLINAFSGLYQTSALGLAGTFPSIFLQAIMFGQGIGGVIPSLALIFFRGIFSISNTMSDEDELHYSALSYFVFAIVIIIICIICFFMLKVTPYSRYFIKKAPLPSKSKSFLSKLLKDFLSIWKLITPDMFIAFFTFAVTLSIFPSISAEVYPSIQYNTKSHTADLCVCKINSTNLSSINNTYLSKPTDYCGTWPCLFYSIVLCFLVFNLFDSMGRLLAGITTSSIVNSWKLTQLLIKINKHSRLNLSLSVARIVFIPLILLCNINNKRLWIPTAFNSDIVFATLMVLIGLSNGLVSTIAVMAAPGKVDVKFKESAAILMGVSIGLGLLTGSLFGYLISWILIS